MNRHGMHIRAGSSPYVFLGPLQFHIGFKQTTQQTESCYDIDIDRRSGTILNICVKWSNDARPRNALGTNL